ncbi:MAG: C40 family peptidase [Nocardioides sp.]
MRRLAVATLTLTLVAGVGGLAAADPGGTVPSKADVRHAHEAVFGKATDVAGVRAQLVLANQRLQDSAVRADQAAEAFNGARYHLQQARRAARLADRHAAIARQDVARQRQTYADSVVASYQLAPSLSALSAITHSTGIRSVVHKVTTVHNAQDILSSEYDSYQASATLAGVADQQAADAQAEAATLAQQARTARDAAKSAADAALAEATSIAAEKTRLVRELAHLQHVSVAVAQRRQSGLEAAAAAAAAQAAAEAAAQQQAQEAAQEAAQHQHHDATSNGSGSGPSDGTSGGATSTDQPSGPPTPTPPPSDPTPTPPPSDPTPTPPPSDPPAPQPPSPPAPSGGAAAAISFARAQIGEPYQWGAAGPDAWDCSGLTMGAWRAGGKYLPHYSAAQYDQSTPISAGALRPGDLVFWGSSSSPSSIYHEAIYSGNGMIVQAPRTGENVAEASMYSWIAPNFYARP